jgi:hypothetical protein
MVGRRLLLVSTLIACFLFGIGAAQNPVVEMNLLTAFTYTPSTEQWGNVLIPDLKLTIRSENSGNVRGEISLGTPTVATPSISIDDFIRKAFLRARFPSFRLTAGKTRLSWGDGMLFNAADILYGSSSVSVDLTQAELRSKTDWMINVNYPLGFFSFAEAVFLPSMTGEAQDMGVGGRFYTNAGETKVEGGYLTKKETTRVHKLYTSLQGNIGPDWYLASSITIDQSNPSASDIQKSWLISGGLFHMQYLSGERNLSLRLEMLSRPFGTWKFESQSEASCALLLYPEVVYSPTSTLSFSLRAILSPLDLSTLLSAGASWSVFEGFALIANIAAPFGESGDVLLPVSSSNALGMTLGASWIY